MKLGVDEPKKLIMLGALVAVGGYLAFSSVFSSPSAPATPKITQAAVPAVESPEASQPARPARASRSRGQSDEFHPVLHDKRPEYRIDPARVDPTLRLDLLAKVQNAQAPGSARNVFQFAPLPVTALPPEPKIALATPPVATPPPGPPPPPPPPPITLRYYGFTSVPGTTTKTAFFLDGDEILVGKEGDTLKRRYRVVRIGATSAVVEDTESKHQQTLALAEEAAG